MNSFAKIFSIAVFTWCLFTFICTVNDFNNTENYMYTKTENTIFIDEYATKTKYGAISYERFCIDGELLRLKDSTIVQLEDITNVKSSQYRSLESGIPVFMYINNENERILFTEMMYLILLFLNIILIVIVFKD